MNILISGMTCSGKTYLSKTLESEFNSSVIHEDDYYKDLMFIPKSKGYFLMDSPNAFNTEEFIRDVCTLLREGSVLTPTYDVSINRRVSKNTVVRKSGINVFEGLHTISLLPDLEDSLKVFIDTDIEECLKRRIKRDSAIPEEKIRQYFKEVILPLYRLYIEKQRNQADVIIKGRDDELCLLKKLGAL